MKQMRLQRKLLILSQSRFRLKWQYEMHSWTNTSVWPRDKEKVMARWRMCILLLTENRPYLSSLSQNLISLKCRPGYRSFIVAMWVQFQHNDKRLHEENVSSICSNKNLNRDAKSLKSVNTCLMCRYSHTFMPIVNPNRVINITKVIWKTNLSTLCVFSRFGVQNHQHVFLDMRLQRNATSSRDFGGVWVCMSTAYMQASPNFQHRISRSYLQVRQFSRSQFTYNAKLHCQCVKMKYIHLFPSRALKFYSIIWNDDLCP